MNAGKCGEPMINAQAPHPADWPKLSTGYSEAAAADSNSGGSSESAGVSGCFFSHHQRANQNVPNGKDSIANAVRMIVKTV